MPKRHRRDASAAWFHLSRATGPISVQIGDVTAPVPDALRAVVLDALTRIAAGQIPRVVGGSPRVTTTQAATLAGMSRMTLVRLLDAGELPFTWVGRHRRVDVADIEAWCADQSRVARDTVRERRKRRAAAALQEVFGPAAAKRGP